VLGPVPVGQHALLLRRMPAWQGHRPVPAGRQPIWALLACLPLRLRRGDRAVLLLARALLVVAIWPVRRPARS
jgi:hypothetical protein